MQGLFGGGLDFGVGAGVREDDAIEEDEGGLFVGFGVVEDGLETGVVGRVFDRDDGGGDFGDPLLQGEFDARGVGFEVGAHGVGFVVAGGLAFFFVEGAFDVDEGGEPVDDGPEVGD